MAKAKRTATGALFRRNAREWREVLPYGGLADALALLPQLGIPFLLAHSMLNEAEADMIRAVADGRAPHEFLTQEAAQRYAEGLN
ncbi:hypothetical protein ACH47C_05920 [Streptomyces rishiriensis]|uniref:hypothetical protein n=1 Tax=Streptomyces rishiriensis TaxID=68264 RepID=UPI0033F524E1